MIPRDLDDCVDQLIRGVPHDHDMRGSKSCDGGDGSGSLCFRFGFPLLLQFSDIYHELD